MRCSGSRRRTPRSIWSRSEAADWPSGTACGSVSGRVDLDAPPSGASLLVPTGVQEEAVEPGLEALEVAQRGQVPPAPDERLLDGVLRLVGVTEDEACGGIQSTDRGACQHGEGVMIAPLRPHHEIPLHAHPSSFGAAEVVALEGYGACARGRVPDSCSSPWTLRRVGPGCSRPLERRRARSRGPRRRGRP